MAHHFRQHRVQLCCRGKLSYFQSFSIFRKPHLHRCSGLVTKKIDSWRYWSIYCIITLLSHHYGNNVLLYTDSRVTSDRVNLRLLKLYKILLLKNLFFKSISFSSIDKNFVTQWFCCYFAMFGKSESKEKFGKKNSSRYRFQTFAIVNCAPGLVCPLWKKKHPHMACLS